MAYNSVLILSAVWMLAVASADQTLLGLPSTEDLIADTSAIASLTTQPAAGRKLLQVPSCQSLCAQSPKLAICGANGKSYDSYCTAVACQKVKFAYFGTCNPKPCLCPALFYPVCGGGKTYLNPCFAQCAGVKASPGACKGDCNCPATKAPVCAKDGNTYDNACLATCKGTEAWYSGSCDARIGTCKCAPSYSPVCGTITTTTVLFGVKSTSTSSLTYSSACLAKCDGASKTTPGLCKDDSSIWDAKSFWCGCSLKYDPVCVNIPVVNITSTMTNACIAKCLGYKVLGKGVCGAAQCLCPFPDKPVCAGKTTYKNACLARCQGKASTWTAGACAGTVTCDKCPLPTADSFVCGEDNKIYPTACNAQCLGIKVKSKGLCGIKIPGVGK